MSPERSKTICRQPGCGKAGHGPYCPDHVQNNDRSNKDADECYKSAAWTKFSKFLRLRNPICQKLWKGQRCMRPSALVHHIVSPRMAPARLLDPTNCACLCRQCHPVTEGTVNWVAGIDFVPTSYSISL
jgi:hypothetical protein